MTSVLSYARLRPLAAGIAALLALAAPAVQAGGTSTIVANCDDSGPGSLRAAVAAAPDSGTVDASQLNCSTISLHTGAITVAQNNLVLVGPGRNALTISGEYNGNVESDRIIHHTGSGTLSIQGLTLTQGYVNTVTGGSTPILGGGCLMSPGTLTLDDVEVSHCSVHASSGKYSALGGAILSTGSLSLHNSTVHHGSLSSTSSSPSIGGGIAANGNLTLVASEVSDNTIDGQGFGGGVFAGGATTYIAYSTIADNQAYLAGGVIAGALTGAAAIQFTLVNSTISSNHASAAGGGVALSIGTGASVQIRHSTIAFNSAATTMSQSTRFSPGLTVLSSDASLSVALGNSLIANNTYGTPAVDDDLDVSNATITGTHNLLLVSGVVLPAGNTIGVCPKLGPLSSNGGSTRTRAVLPGSFAIDAGASDDDGLDHDQRGAPFPRLSGAATDIGAFEVLQNDAIFTNGFDVIDDGCS